MNLSDEEKLRLLLDAGGVLYSEDEGGEPVFLLLSAALRFCGMSEEERSALLRDTGEMVRVLCQAPDELVRIGMPDGSMLPDIQPGDGLFIAYREPVLDGMAAAVAVEGGEYPVTVREVRYREEGTELIPYNSRFSPAVISADSGRILGPVRGVERGVKGPDHRAAQSAPGPALC